MKHLNKISLLLLLFLWIVTNSSCKKQDKWLNAKRLIGDVTPQTLKDYQAILDNYNLANSNFTTLGLVSSDNLYLTDKAYSGAYEVEREAYIWSENIWDVQNGISYSEWNVLYKTIEWANVVLDGLKLIKERKEDYDNIKGQAYFYRAISNLNLCQLFCKSYDSKTATTDLGIPLRLTSDVNKIYKRSTLKQTYSQILSDAKKASELCYDQQEYKSRPSKYSAMALLAKTCLIMGDYKQAKLWADKVIGYGFALLDFNNPIISLNNTYRFPEYGTNNPEIIFYAQSQYNLDVCPNTRSKGLVDTTLYTSYDANDLRRKYFYAPSNDGAAFRGGYTGNKAVFCGISINEVYLIRAECYAREGNTTAAMHDLNILLSKRYVSGTFHELTADSPETALRMVLKERRKELPFVSNIRWEDLKRLNKEKEFQVTITRIINGKTYTLQPNSNAYVFPIPESEVQMTGIQQNPR